MRFSSTFLAAAGLAATANAAVKGFNYGAMFNNDQAKTLADFEYEFNAAKQLPGTDGWTSARLYTMIQHGSTSDVIEAIQAAINTNTTLLLGLWASAGQAGIDKELTALKAAIQKYGTSFTDLVVGISVGSEDLYRITPTGIKNKSGAGAQPSELVKYVQQTRDVIKGTGLGSKPIGHVDTWTTYTNTTNSALISAVDFIGVDAYPYFESSKANNVGSASQIFFDGYHAVVGAAQGKPVWVTETGWPVTGETLNQGVASKDNARIYWEDVTCQLVKDNVNLYYYILQDVQYGNPSPSFGIKPAGDIQPTITATPEENHPIPTVVPSLPAFSPTGLPEPFEAPHLIGYIDQSDPTKIIGDGYTAQLSPTISSIFVFDINPVHSVKTCTLTLHLPPPFDLSAFAPVHISSTGGVSVSRIGSVPATTDAVLVGGVSSVQLGHQYEIASGPCEAGQRVGYEVESIGGLSMGWFQMTSPPLGLFMLVN